MEESITTAASGLKIVKNNSSSWSSEGLFLNYSEDAPINPTSNGQTVMVHIENIKKWIYYFIKLLDFSATAATTSASISNN